MLTGYNSTQFAIEALQLGACNYIPKPCDRREPLCLVEKCFYKLELERKTEVYERLLPVCPKCKKIPEEISAEKKSGAWVDLEQFFKKHQELESQLDHCENCEEIVKKEIEELKSRKN